MLPGGGSVAVLHELAAVRLIKADPEISGLLWTVYSIPVSGSGCGASVWCSVGNLRRHLYRLRQIPGSLSIMIFWAVWGSPKLSARPVSSPAAVSRRGRDLLPGPQGTGEKGNQ